MAFRTKAQKLAYSREWSRTNPEKKRAANYKSAHNEPIANKIARLEAQGYKCANPICLKPVDLTIGHQDHNHLTGENRGVLCAACNKALGLLDDNAEMLAGLTSYRRRFS